MIKRNVKSDKKRYVIYTRCSTDDQAQGDFTTLDAQAYHCKNMLDAFGYDLADIGSKGIVKDDGYSGKDLNRPGIQMIIEHVRKKAPFDGIIFFRLDRLTRNTRDLYWLIDLFREKEIDFVSVRENLDSSTAIGRVVIGILGILSAFERELIGERVKASCIARVRQGKWVGGNVPFGYKLVDHGEALPNGRQPRKIIIDPEIGPRIRFIWEMAADNRSLYDIASELTKRGIKTPTKKSWRKQSISWIIKNPFHKGYIKYGDELHKGNHQALVDEELWEKANKVLTAKLPGHRFVKRPQEYIYLLAGLIKCGKCGSNYVSESGTGRSGKFFYYVCGRSKQKLGCDTSRISAAAFDNALIDYFKRASNDREIIVKAIGEAILDSQVKLEKIEKLINPLENKLEKARGEAKKLLDLAMNNAIPRGRTYKDKMTKLDEEILKLEDELEKLRAKERVAQMSVNSSEFLHSNLRFAMENIDQAPPDAQKSLIRALIKDIIVHSDRIEIRMYIGTEIASSAASPPPRNDGSSELTASSARSSPERQGWLGCLDSNQEQLLQRQSCYHYTTSQRFREILYYGSFIFQAFSVSPVFVCFYFLLSSPRYPLTILFY